jgi:hypothetical protein
VIRSPHRPGRIGAQPGGQRQSPAGRRRLVFWGAGRTLWILPAAVWAGAVWAQGPGTYIGAAFVSFLTVLLLASSVFRLSRLLQAGRADSRAPAGPVAGVSRLAQRHPRRGLLYAHPGGRLERGAAGRPGTPRDGGRQLG